MTTLIYAGAIVGTTILLITTIALVWLNWSEKTYTPALSIFLIGIATTLAAVWVTLKPSTIESAFSTSVVLDTTEGAPPMIDLDQNNLKLTSRLSELVLLGRPAVNRGGKTVITIQKPTSEGERFTFVGELLQYRVLGIIEQLQRGGWKVGQTLGASTATISKPMKLSQTEDYPGRTFLSVVAGNRFSDSDMERFHWEHGHLPLPKNTRITLPHLATSPATGTEKFTVKLQKPLFFEIDFVIEPLAGTGLGVLPPGLTLASEIKARCETYQFQITMRANFEKITAGNSQTEEYKDWANWLYSSVRDKLGD